jgi:hypothetical protein
MTDEQFAAMRWLLAEYHRNLAKQAIRDVVHQDHADLGRRLADEAAQIPRRTAMLPSAAVPGMRPLPVSQD